MTKELQPVPTDIHLLAEDACRSMAKNSIAASDETSNRHDSLAAGLERVRGVAIQRAKAANVRLRKQAYGGTALGFGLGVALGLLISRIRSGELNFPLKIPQLSSGMRRGFIAAKSRILRLVPA
jgi:hypothetical protein